MIQPSSEIELSPLDQIRQIESEVLRQTAAARKMAEEIIETARSQAEALKRDAHETGTKQGQMRYREMVSRAEEEAQILVEEARNEEDELRHAGQRRMQAAASFAVDFVICVDEKGNNQ